MPTTIGTARANLFALLGAHAWPTSAIWPEQPELSWGPPTTVTAQQIVAMRGVEGSDENHAVFGGPKPRGEDYTIVLTLEVHGPEHDAITVEARFWELAEEIREVIYANRTLNGALPSGLGARVTSKTSDDAAMPADKGGVVMFGFVRVLCQARIA